MSKVKGICDRASGEPVELSDVLDLMLNAVCVVDREGRFLFVSAAFERIFGYAPHEVVGTPMIDRVLAEDRARTLNQVGTLLAGQMSSHFENRWVHKDGRVVHVLWTARWSEKHQARIAVAHDITERKQMEDRLKHMAVHDPLTHLPNRVLLKDRLSTALASARRESTYLALLFIDMDGFKQVNDQHGHGVGDALLQEVARRLGACVRETDTVGRWGGDEFLVLLTGLTDLADAEPVAEKIRAELARRYDVAGRRLTLAPSVGVAHYPEHGEGDQQLVQHADQAMYGAKKAGGNRCWVYGSQPG